MRSNTFIIVGLVVLGILGIGLTAVMLLGRSGGGGNSAPPPEAAPTTVQAWVAAREIPPRTTITTDMLEQRELSPQEAEGAITDRDQILGRLVAQPIAGGQIITEDKLAEGLARVVPANFPIPAGLRAVAVYVNADRTAAGLVDIGDRVDVIVTHELSGGGENSAQTVSGRTIAQNLEVLAVDRSLEEATKLPQPEATPGEAPPPPPPPPENPVQTTAEANYRVVLAAPPTVAERIAAANRSGQINLTIRNPDFNEVLPAIAEAIEYPARRASPDSAAERQAAQQRADQLRQEQRADRLAARERATAREARREEFANQLKLAEIESRGKVPPMPMPDLQKGTQSGTLPKPAGQDGEPSSAQEVLVVRGTEKTRVLVPSR